MYFNIPCPYSRSHSPNRGTVALLHGHGHERSSPTTALLPRLLMRAISLRRVQECQCRGTVAAAPCLLNTRPERFRARLRIEIVSLESCVRCVRCGRGQRESTAILAETIAGMIGTRAQSRTAMVRGVLCIVLMNTFRGSLMAEELPSCSFPAVYTFGDSLTDNGNAVAAFPEQFMDSVTWPNGVLAPRYPAGRYCDGWLLTDYIAFGVGARPNSPILESIGGDFTYGANFAMAGATARNNSAWFQNSGLNTPFSLNIQVSWLLRYKARLQFYAEQFAVSQSLPIVESLNSSLYVVNAGFQDYFSILYNQTSTSSSAEAHDRALGIVPSVVEAIIEAVQRIHEFGAKHILIVNIPPLGCVPSLLSTYYEDSASSYDGYGCMKTTNRISKYHNTLLADGVNDLRDTIRDATVYLADIYRVHTEVLRLPSDYGISNPLRACCGYGGAYNFNNQTTCGHVGPYNGITISLRRPCLFPSAFASWDGIHPSSRMNLAAATAFFAGKHMTPKGGFRCMPDTSNWNLTSSA